MRRSTPIRSTVSLLGLLTLAALAGCRGAPRHSAGLAGSYALDRAATVTAGARAYLEESERVQRSGGSGGASVGPVNVPLGMDPEEYASWNLARTQAALQLSSDGRFTRTTSVDGRETHIVGTWSVEGDHVVLVTTEAGVVQSVRAAALPDDRVQVGSLVFARHRE